MGKIRIKTLGDESAEKEQKTRLATKRDEAKKRKEAVKVEEKAAEPVVEEKTQEKAKEEPVKEVKKEVKKKKASSTPTQTRSQKYLQAKMQVDTAKQYSLSEALKLLSELQKAKFDETVELHVVTTETGVTLNVNLPHGTGKKTRVIVATDEIIADVEKGTIDFDILVATPDMMPKLAKVAKYLGPRGLMPSPKNGTVTTNPDEVVKKYEGGHTTFKTETKFPLLHLRVGKISLGSDKLTENINVVMAALPLAKVKTVTLKSTMSPAIKINFAS